MDEKMEMSVGRWVGRYIAGTALLLLTILACGCRPCRQIQMVKDAERHTESDTSGRVLVRMDSVVVKDSVVMMTRGDTVVTERWHTGFRDRLRVDTVERVRTETLWRTVVETERVETERRRRWWETALLIGAGVILVWNVIKRLRSAITRFYRL